MRYLYIKLKVKTKNATGIKEQKEKK